MSAALTNSSHAPDKGKHSESAYLSDNSCSGRTEDVVAYGRLMPDRTRNRTALLQDITATGNFDSLQQSSVH